MEADRTMVHRRLVARAKDGSDLWLTRQSCRDGLDALLLIQGGVDWDLECVFDMALLGLGDFGCFFWMA